MIGACLVLDRDVPASLGRFLTAMIYAELPMVLIGTDSHKRTHPAVALDEWDADWLKRRCRRPVTGTWRWSAGPGSGLR